MCPGRRVTYGKIDVPTINHGLEDCPREAAQRRLANRADSRVDVSRFQGLHPDGRKLVRGWIEKAVRSDRGNEFEAFIYAWIGFNGWASCCCAQDGDRTLLRMMMLDDRLTQNYNRVIQENVVREAAVQFASYWPIFRVSDLSESIRRKRPSRGNRADIVGYYHTESPEAERAPECHLRHQEHIEADWSHTLEALYRVRCNLFHGGKSGAGKEDREIVVAAAGVLIPIAESVLALH
jgi:hypothetical protein